MGSGTTIFTAYEMGRSAIGIEIMPEYVALAEDALKNLSQRLF
jgi:DNA modification methylase